MKLQASSHVLFRKFMIDVENKLGSLYVEEGTIREIMAYISKQDLCLLDNKNVTITRRVKKDISVNEQCNATRMDGERCTRRKKQDGHFCGTHINCPSPIAFTVDTVPSITDKVVSAIDIQGIIYYIDEDLNVYNTEDVLNDVVDPMIIGQACYKNGIYTIPSLGLI